MKTLKITLAALFISALTFAQTKETKPTTFTVEEPVKSNQPTGLKFDKETHDFGTLQQGKPSTYEFTFVNESKETILITGVKPSCGCTAANYTKTPIKPGEKGFVAATYNAGSAGAFTKSIIVTTSDTTASKSLIIKGKVEPAAAPAPAGTATVSPIKS